MNCRLLLYLGSGALSGIPSTAGTQDYIITPFRGSNLEQIGNECCLLEGVELPRALGNNRYVIISLRRFTGHRKFTSLLRGFSYTSYMHFLKRNHQRALPHKLLLHCCCRRKHQHEISVSHSLVCRSLMPLIPYNHASVFKWWTAVGIKSSWWCRAPATGMSLLMVLIFRWSPENASKSLRARFEESPPRVYFFMVLFFLIMVMIQ